MAQRVWMVGRGSLTGQQEQIVNLPTDRNHLIVGTPGSGKTILLLHRANDLLSNRSVSPRHLRVFVFTNVLRDYIQAGAQTLNLPFEIVQSFYSWVFQLAQQEGIPKSKASRLEDRCRETLCALTQYFETEKVPSVLDAVLVDEGQDLPKEAYRLFARAARHVTLFADYTQRLYSGGAPLKEALTGLGIRSDPVTLMQNLRSSNNITALAAQFLPARDRLNYVQTQARPNRGTIRIPLLFRAATPGQEWDRMAEILKQEITRNARVAILTVDNAMVNSTYNHLSALNVPVQKIVAREAVETDFNDATPKILTLFSAKGLSFDTVLLPRITQNHYTHVGVSPLQMLFVACTRALDWVYLSTVEGSELKELQQLRDLVSAGKLIEQCGRLSVEVAGCCSEPREDAPF